MDQPCLKIAGDILHRVQQIPVVPILLWWGHWKVLEIFLDESLPDFESRGSPVMHIIYDLANGEDTLLGWDDRTAYTHCVPKMRWRRRCRA